MEDSSSSNPQCYRPSNLCFHCKTGPESHIGQEMECASRPPLPPDEVDMLLKEIDELNADSERLTAELETAQMDAAVAGTETGAYWKGHDEAVRGVAERWREALEDPMPKSGAMNEPLEGLYRRTEALRAERDRLLHEAKQDESIRHTLANEVSRLRAALERGFQHHKGISGHDYRRMQVDVCPECDMYREALAGADTQSRITESHTGSRIGAADGERGHTCHNGATIYLLPGKKCQWCGAENRAADSERQQCIDQAADE